MQTYTDRRCEVHGQTMQTKGKLHSYFTIDRLQLGIIDYPIAIPSITLIQHIRRCKTRRDFTCLTVVIDYELVVIDYLKTLNQLQQFNTSDETPFPHNTDHSNWGSPTNLDSHTRLIHHTLCFHTNTYQYILSQQGSRRRKKKMNSNQHTTFSQSSLGTRFALT